jgi:PAS domain S-box-containing protein
LNSILSTIHEGTLLVSLEGSIVTTNRVLTEFIGLAHDELEGNSLFTSDMGGNLLSQIGYELADWQADCAALTHGEKWRTAHIVMSGSQEREVERTLVPVHNELDEITGWLLIFRDITEEIELAKSREETIHMLVHDLRSPLSVTMGSLETMDAWLEMGRTDDVRRLLDLANTGGQRMLQLLNNLLDSYKFESGNMSLNHETIPILPWLADLKAQFGPAASIANLSLELNVEPGLPMLWADKGHMTRVIANLVDNAIKFTPDGGDIELWARYLDGAEKTILMGVSDNGLGIPPEEQAKLFDKFRQNANVRGRHQGTGLGLTYCKLVVEAHNGRIWIESEGIKGQGSTFIVALSAFDEHQT